MFCIAFATTRLVECDGVVTLAGVTNAWVLVIVGEHATFGPCNAAVEISPCAVHGRCKTTTSQHRMLSILRCSSMCPLISGQSAIFRWQFLDDFSGFRINTTTHTRCSQFPVYRMPAFGMAACSFKSPTIRS